MLDAWESLFRAEEGLARQRPQRGLAALRGVRQESDGVRSSVCLRVNAEGGLPARNPPGMSFSLRARCASSGELARDGDEALDLAAGIRERCHLQMDDQLAAVEGTEGERESAGSTLDEVMRDEVDHLRFELGLVQEMADRLIEGLREWEARQTGPSFSSPLDETGSIANENRLPPRDRLRPNSPGNLCGGGETFPRWG